MNNRTICEEIGVNRSHLHSHPSDTVIGIVIAIIGTLTLLARLHVVQMSFNLPGDLVTWWPLLLISWGVVLLLPQRAGR